MQLIMGGINGRYLRNITENCARDTEEVLAAVAYATDATLLFDWCWEHGIPLKYYGRLADEVAVATPILETFLKRSAARFECRLVQHHHAKVIWWRGHGVYIGSANLTDPAWNKNVEVGCFFPDTEIDDETGGQILALFSTLHANSTLLTDELLAEMRSRASALHRAKLDAKQFWKHPSFVTWPGLVTTSKLKASEVGKETFLKEWHATLQILRKIGEAVSQPENRPLWIRPDAPAGAQADQFLHAHYYQRTFNGRKADYENYFQRNRSRADDAMAEAMQWWRDLPAAPNGEDKMINDDAPLLQATMAEDSLRKMTEVEFREICSRTHAIIEYARRVPNKTVGLVDDGRSYTIPEKVSALSQYIWTGRTATGHAIPDVLHYILYSGPENRLPERLWQAVTDPRWKLDGLGVSALGELVGWALPERFPPRNGRTSKALRSLGHDVTVHVS